MFTDKKVMVAMSGGVDSAVAAFLLLEQGYEVAGGTFRLFGSNEDQAVCDAKITCDALNIPHHVFDFRQAFDATVVSEFASEYERGATPNPCVICNRTIKFGKFLQAAGDIGYGHIATGHYAKIVCDGHTGRYRVKRSDYPQKDQSYVLYSLSQEQLKHVLLPLGGYSKPEIRKIAESNNLIVSQKPDSQDICFIKDGNYNDFLNAYIHAESPPGDFLSIDGVVLGRHKGIRNYTIGQRKGLGLSFSEPMYVTSIDAAANTVILAPNSSLFKSCLLAKDFNWIDPIKPEAAVTASAKIRYGAALAPATAILRENSGHVKICFEEPQRAITIGQSVVLYDGDYLIGGGIIDSVE